MLNRMSFTFEMNMHNLIIQIFITCELSTLHESKADIWILNANKICQLKSIIQTNIACTFELPNFVCILNTLPEAI